MAQDEELEAEWERPFDKAELDAIASRKMTLREEREEPLVSAYIEEAEHQEGQSYWLSFPDEQAVLDDFDLYLTVLAETGAEAGV